MGSTFQSTLPTRGSDRPPKSRPCARCTFQSTLPTRGSDSTTLYAEGTEAVSIHAPHEGERPESVQYLTAKVVCVSIHAPHEGERPYILPRCRHIRQFQSTLPTRGSDQALMYCEDGLAAGFNPRSPRGGATGSLRIGAALPRCFNPRSPRGGATPPYAAFDRHQRRFNPRSPRGGATAARLPVWLGLGCFNPRSPRGGATRTFWRAYRIQYGFQSTLPTRGSDA